VRVLAFARLPGPFAGEQLELVECDLLLLGGLLLFLRGDDDAGTQK
jgi:hypothetical protein